MTAITAEHFKKNVNEYIDMAVSNNARITLTTEKGNAILVGEEEYRSLVETLRLMNASGMKERVAQARNTPVEESEDFEW